MAWWYLLLAGLFEIGWPVGLKLATKPHWHIAGVALAVAFMACSGFFLWQAQKHIPIGTAYAVWTGIGAAGTFLLGVVFFGDAGSLWRYMGVGFIILGAVLLKVGA